MPSSPIPAARSQHLLGLLAQVPNLRKRRGRRHALAGLLAAGIAAVIAGSRLFAVIGQWAADAGPKVLAVLGAASGAAEESTFRRAFAVLGPGRLDQAPGAWLWTRAVQVSGRMVIAVDGKTVCGAKDKEGKAPHLAAALAPAWIGFEGAAQVAQLRRTVTPASPPPAATTPAARSGRCGCSRTHDNLDPSAAVHGVSRDTAKW